MARACMVAMFRADGDEICDFKHIRADTTQLWLVHVPPDVSLPNADTLEALDARPHHLRSSDTCYC